MIKIELEIEEKETKKFEEIEALCVDVGIIEISKNSTKAEKEALYLLKKKLGIEEKTQIINNCRYEQNKKLVDLISSLIK